MATNAAVLPPRKPLYKNLTFQVLTAVFVGGLLGAMDPRYGEALKPLGDGFIRLVKMVVGPIIFLTIVVGISSMGDLRKVGRVGIKALAYFEIVTTIALAIGLLVANVVQPGAAIHAHEAPATAPAPQTPASRETRGPQSTRPTSTAPAGTQPAATRPATAPVNEEVARYQKEAQRQSTGSFLLEIIPDNIFRAFAEGNLLQILFFSILFGIALASLHMRETGLMIEMEHLVEVMFRMVGIIMKIAPLGAMGAMAYTVGKYGLASLLPLMKLMVCVYLTMFLFIFVVLGIIAWLFRFSLLRYLAFIREEILLVLGTSSSESALPRMIEKLELLGCSRGVVGMVVPAGYSFNLDGTSIYLSMAVLFIAQAFGVHMSFWQQVYVMAVLMVTSKGAAAVTGAGFVTLAATLESTHVLPLSGLALLLGADRFMSEARAITNLIGNGVAAICISKWEGEFDEKRYQAAIRGHALELPGLPTEVQADVAKEGDSAF